MTAIYRSTFSSNLLSNLNSHKFQKPFQTVRHYSAKQKLNLDLSLTLVTNRKAVLNEMDFYTKIKKSIEGGVSCIQLRDNDEDKTFLETAYRLKNMMKNFSIPLIINDRVDIALASKAEGVHLGQKDIPYPEARRLLGKKAIIGLTVDCMEDVIKAEELDVDYLGVQIFPSKLTKQDSTHFWGLEGLQQILSYSKHRIVVIGGITLENVGKVSRVLYQEDDSIGKMIDYKHKHGIAVVGALFRAADPCGTAEQIRKIMKSSPIST